jgi:hypothetical protein
MIKPLWILTSAVFSMNAFAVDSWQGYKPIEQVSAPHKELAMASVFQIKTVTLLEKNKNKYEVVDMAKTKNVTQIPRIGDDSRSFQIETCRNQGLQKCPIFTTSETGTGFINNGHDFYTCRHMIHNWVVIAAKENSMGIEHISPPIELLDYKHNLIYSSAAAGINIMSISMINTDQRLNYVLKEKVDLANKIDFFFALSEYVALVSPVDLIPAHTTKFTQTVENNDQIFASGYPAKTTLFGGPRKGDTGGDQLVSSVGNVVQVKMVQQVVASMVLVTPGMSGGMVTNANGEILGMSCNGPNGKKLEPDMSSTTIMLDEPAQRNLWQLILNTPL